MTDHNAPKAINSVAFDKPPAQRQARETEGV